MLFVPPNLRIAEDELKFTFVRSSGPGGQNVNKVASKAVLHWNVRLSSVLPEDARRRLISREARRINVRGELVLSSQRHRDQLRNVSDCLAKLVAIVAAAAKKPRPRKKTRPTVASREARLSQKRALADKKRQRRRPADDA